MYRYFSQQSRYIGIEDSLVLCKYRISMQLKKNRPAELKSKINAEFLENESIRLLFQNRLSSKDKR